MCVEEERFLAELAQLLPIDVEVLRFRFPLEPGSGDFRHDYFHRHCVKREDCRGRVSSGDDRERPIPQASHASSSSRRGDRHLLDGLPFARGQCHLLEKLA